MFFKLWGFMFKFDSTNKIENNELFSILSVCILVQKIKEQNNQRNTNGEGNQTT